MNVSGETENSQSSETTEDGTETTSTETTTTEEVKPLIEGEKTETVAEEFVPLTAEDITFPDGFEVQEEFRDEFLTVVNNQELSPKDRAQALTDLYSKAAIAASEASSNAFVEQQKAMQAEVKADPEIGGDKLQATLSNVNKLITEYGSDELVEEFAATGIGNSARFIKFLNTVAGYLTEGKPVTNAAPVNQEADRASRMFPSMKG